MREFCTFLERAFKYFVRLLLSIYHAAKSLFQVVKEEKNKGQKRNSNGNSLETSEMQINPFTSNELVQKMDFYENISSDKWTCLREDKENNISVFSLKEENAVTSSGEKHTLTFKIIATFPADNLSVKQIFDQYWNLQARFEWDPNCMHNLLIRELSEDSRIVHFRTKPIWPTTSRDAVLLNERNLKNLPFQADNLYTQSEHHHNIPVPKDTVRMTVLFQGQRIRLETLPNGGSSQIKIMQMIVGNPNGWIPDAVIRKITTKSVPAQMLKVKELASNHQISLQSSCSINSKQREEEIIRKLQQIEYKLDLLIEGGKKRSKIDLKNISGSFVGCLLLHVISYYSVRKIYSLGGKR